MISSGRQHDNHFQGTFEIVPLTGTISALNSAYYAHLHMSAGDEAGNVCGGHLNQAIVSAICEMVIRAIEGRVNRAFDENVGLNLLQFD